jgi:hypothetical protein
MQKLRSCHVAVLNGCIFFELYYDSKFPEFSINGARVVSASGKLISGVTFNTRAGIAQSVQRLATDWTTEGSEFEFRYVQEFLLLHVVQTGSGVHLTFYPMGTRGSFPECKAAVA